MTIKNRIKDTINEAIAVNYVSDARFNKYIELISKKFKLGPSVSFKVRGTDHYVRRFGKATNKLVSGKYVYLLFDFHNKKRAKAGFITSFIVSSEEMSSGFKLDSTGNGFIAGSHVSKPIPKDFVKFEDVMSLVIGAGVDFDRDKTKITPAVVNGNITEEIQEFNVNERFAIMANLVRVVSMKTLPGMLIVGKGGIGKTYTVTETLRELGMLEDEDYKYFQGLKLTTTRFYKLLHDNRDTMIIFDEADSVLENEDAVMMLKAALDSGSDSRIVRYDSPAVAQMDLPDSFEYTGRIIFISNIAIDKIAQPLISRSVTVDAGMTREETYERMQFIIDKDAASGDPEKVERAKWRQQAYDIIYEYDQAHPGRPKDLNSRTLDKIAKILASNVPGMSEQDKIDMAKYNCSVS